MPAYLISKKTSVGPGSRLVMVVGEKEPVAESMAYAAT